MSEYKMVIVMRKDLGMRKGKMIAQGAHAAIELLAERGDDPECETWEDQGGAKIVLGVDTGAELLDIAGRALKAGFATAVIRDAGRTEISPGTATCCAIGPGPADEIDKITGDLKLL